MKTNTMSISPAISSRERVKTGEMLAIGFQKQFKSYLRGYSPTPNSLKIREFDNSFMAYRWLERCLNSGREERLPKALVCDYGKLKEEEFLLFRNVRANEELRHIPFILMNREKGDPRAEALELGVDDCYNVPISWNSLVERIEFLRKYKPFLTPCEKEKREKFNFKSPLGIRLFDILFASFLILIFSPLYILLAILIRLESKGPVIYRSKRVGTGYQVFDFFKFRSMYANADQKLEKLAHLNQYNGKSNGHLNGVNGHRLNGKKKINDDGKSEGNGLFLKFHNDPRVTKVGHIIRKTSLDELPQLFNVLRGEMSIVGNRPLPLYEAEQLTRDVWARRFLAPAGLTGLWQVTKRGKNEMSTEERIALDITYAQKFSFWFDLKIILKTPLAMFQEENV